jgi:hypothetical protein
MLIITATKISRVLHMVTEERTTKHRKKGRMVHWIGINLHRITLIKHIIEGKTDKRVEVMERECRRRKKLLDILKKTRGY